MGSLSCPFCCGGSHTTEDNLRDHLMYVIYKPDRCPICRDDYFYPNKLEFIEHFIKKHKGKGCTEKKDIQNTSGYVSIATSDCIQKDLSLLQARNILYQQDENTIKTSKQEHPPLAEVCKKVDEKKKGCQIQDDRRSHEIDQQHSVLETKEFSLENHRIQVEESLGLKLITCNSCGEMIRGQNSYIKHIQEHHLKKSHFSSNNDSVNTKILSFSPHSKSLRLPSPQLKSLDNDSPQSFHASPSPTSHSPQLSSHSPRLQQHSPISSSIVPPSSSSPVLCLPRKPSPSLMSPIPQGSPSMPSQIHSPSGTWDRNLTPTFSENSQERKQSQFLTSSSVGINVKDADPERNNSGSPINQKRIKKDTDEFIYEDTGPGIPRNWYLEKSKVKGPDTPGNHSMRSGGSQISSVNSPAPSEQSIKSGKSGVSSINSPAASELSVRESYSNIYSPATSEFSCKKGKNPSVSISSPAPSPFNLPRYLDSNPISAQESDDFRNLYHMNSEGNSDERSRAQNEQNFKIEIVKVKENKRSALLLENPSSYLPIQETSVEQQSYIHKSGNQPIVNVHALDETCSTLNPANIQERIFELQQKKSVDSYHREPEDFVSSVTNVSQLDTEKPEVKLSNKNVISQSENRTCQASNSIKSHSVSYQNERIIKDISNSEPKLSNLHGKGKNIQELQSLHFRKKDKKINQNLDDYPASSPESLYNNLENSPISIVASPLLSDCDISDLPNQEEPISDIERVVVDVEFSFDDQSHSQPLITQTVKNTFPNPHKQNESPQTTNKKELEVVGVQKESFKEMHRHEKDIDSIYNSVNRSPKECNSILQPTKQEASLLGVVLTIEEQNIPQKCTNKSQEVIPSIPIPKSQENFPPEDTENLEKTHSLDKAIHLTKNTGSGEYLENISDNTQISQEQDRIGYETNTSEKKNKLDDIFVRTKMEPEMNKVTTDLESEMSMYQNTSQQFDESMIHDDNGNDYIDLSIRVGRENMNSYPHKKFRPYEQEKNMQSLTVSVCPDQERNNMQSLTLAKLNRTFDLDPSELTIDTDRKDHKYEGKEEHDKSYEKTSTLLSSNDLLENVSRKRSKLLIDKKQLHKCDQCSKVFKKKYTLVRHYEEVHATNKAFVCDICNKEFGTKRSLENHHDTHLTEKSHKCLQCPHVCQTAGGLRSHVSEIHGDLKNKKGEIKCDYPNCQAKFSKMYGLKRHIARKHSISPSYFCNLCPNKFFSCKEDLSNHLQSHTNSDAMRCKVCDKQFSSFWALQRHKLIHDKNTKNKFKCLDCNQEFTRRDSLVTHRNAKHIVKKDHECEICGQKFVRKNHLQVHQKKKSHTAEPQISCDYCSKTFRFKDSYKRHIHPSDSNHTSACTGLFPRPKQENERS